MTLNRTASDEPWNRSMYFKIDKVLQAKVAKIPNVLVLHNNQNVTIEALADALDSVNAKLADEDLRVSRRVTLEKYKLRLMQETLNCLTHLSGYLERKQQIKKPESRFWYWLKVVGLVVFSIVGFIQSNIMSFVGIQSSIIQLLPSILFPWPIILAAAITVIFAAQYVVFNVNSLRELLGINVRDDNKTVMLVHEKQINLTKHLNDALSDPNIITGLHKSEYLSFRNIAVKCNSDIEEKRETYDEYKKPLATRALTYIFLGLGSLFAAFYSYFSATSLLALVAAPLLGTPVGWGIVAAIMLTGVTFYFALQIRSTNRALNPLMDLFAKIKEKVTTFKVKDEYEFNKTLLNDAVFKPKSEAKVRERRVNHSNIAALDLADRTADFGKCDATLFAPKPATYEMDLSEAKRTHCRLG